MTTVYKLFFSLSRVPILSTRNAAGGGNWGGSSPASVHGPRRTNDR